MRYSDTITLNPGTAAITSHVFRVNSIFDPDLTGTGHQPLLHDEYDGIYSEYRVLKCIAKVTPIASTNAVQLPSFWGCFIDSDSTLGYSSATQAIEDKDRTGSYGLHTGLITAQYNSRTGLPKTRMFNAKRMLTPEGYNNTVDFGANPATGPFDAYLQVWAGSVLGNDPGTVPFLVELEYIVELSGPETITPS